jgi:hypothetical protein
VKLYMKQERLGKFEMDAMLHLIRESTPPHLRGAEPMIVDVPRGKGLKITRHVADLDALLDGEAATFAAMWRLFEDAA